MGIQVGCQRTENLLPDPKGPEKGIGGFLELRRGSQREGEACIPSWERTLGDSGPLAVLCPRHRAVHQLL